MKRILSWLFVVMLAASTLLTGCSVDVNVNMPAQQESRKRHFVYSCATREEGIEYLMSNTEYYKGYIPLQMRSEIEARSGE